MMVYPKTVKNVMTFALPVFNTRITVLHALILIIGCSKIQSKIVFARMAIIMMGM